MSEQTELDAANKRALRLVQLLHARRDFPAEVVTCAEDGQLWPCATRRVISRSMPWANDEVIEVEE